MTVMDESSALERILRPMPKNLSLELIDVLATYQVDEALQDRYEELAEKSTEGQLSDAEKRELGALVRANTLLGLLKAEARAVKQLS